MSDDPAPANTPAPSSDPSPAADGAATPAAAAPAASEAPAPVWAVWRWKLHWQVLLGIVVGLAVGTLSGGPLAPADPGALAGRWDLQLYDLVGGMFMNGLKMIVVPLVAVSIITAMAAIGEQQGFARLGGKTLLFYMASSLVAILIGLGMVNAVAPGEGAGISAADAASAVAAGGSAEAKKMAFLQERTAGRSAKDTINVIKEIVPSNVVRAAADMKMLGVIFFSLLFGYFIGRLEGDKRHVMETFWAGINDVVLDITMLVLRFLPLGVLFLIAKTTATTVADGNALARIGQLAWFALTVLLALGLHAFVVMPLVLAFVARVNPLDHYRAMFPALLGAFSTASSSATLPLTMQCVQHRAGASKRVTCFVLPLGATVNMDGTALYECVAVMFLAQLCGVELTVATQFMVVALALLTSIGVAGIPSASLVAIVIILNAVNAGLPAGQQIPAHALALILVFDRLLDMCRTAVNVFGDSVAAVTIARSEGEEDLYAAIHAEAAPAAA